MESNLNRTHVPMSHHIGKCPENNDIGQLLFVFVASAHLHRIAVLILVAGNKSVHAVGKELADSFPRGSRELSLLNWVLQLAPSNVVESRLYWTFPWHRAD